jgi:hypothetical protein
MESITGDVLFPKEQSATIKKVKNLAFVNDRLLYRLWAWRLAKAKPPRQFDCLLSQAHDLRLCSDWRDEIIHLNSLDLNKQYRNLQSTLAYFRCAVNDTNVHTSLRLKYDGITPKNTFA